LIDELKLEWVREEERKRKKRRRWLDYICEMWVGNGGWWTGG
jgi:siroheme synthase (precorrin-2 oxidase/ferrochelatase)